MIDESVEFRTNELRDTMETATENTTSGINAYGCEYNYELEQQFTEALSSNENEFQSPAAHSDYYATHAEQRQSNLTDDHSVNEQQTYQQTPRIEHLRVPIYSKDYQMREQRYSDNQYSAATIATVASNISSQRELTLTPIINSTSLPVNSIRDYGATEMCGQYTATATLIDNPQQMSSTNNRLSRASEYNNPDVEHRTEAINSVLAHQWHHRREKLPVARDAAFYTEWQINRAEAVNTAEIQKRKLQFFQRAADEQAGRVSKKKATGSTDKQTKKQKQSQLSDSQLQQQQQQQLHQAHRLYRLQQMQQQQNHLRSLTPDSLSSSRQFTNSPTSLHSSYSSAQQQQQQLPQQMFPYVQQLPQQIQLQHPQHQNNDPIYVATFLQQQQLALQMLQQQQLQQQLIQHYPPTAVDPNFFDKWANLNQQKYQEALQENVVRHKSTYGARGQSSRKRKRQDVPRETPDDKENASVNSEPRLVIDEAAAAEPSVVIPMDNAKGNDFLEAKSNFEGNVIVNLNDLAASEGKIAKSNEQPRNQSSLDNLQAGMWNNKYAMLQNWLATQQQSIDQAKSEILQYGLAE